MVATLRPIAMTTPRSVACCLVLLVAVGGCGGSPSPGGPAHGFIRGRVLASPSCPVEVAGKPCPPRPVAGAAVSATPSEGAGGAAATVTDDRGRFRLEVASGRYTVEATNPGGYPSTASTQVVVDAGTVRVTLHLDSGIR